MWLIILYSMGAAYVFVGVLQVPVRLRFLNWKPFNCEVCLSGWIAGIFWYCFHGFTWEMPFVMCLTMLCMAGFEKITN